MKLVSQRTYLPGRVRGVFYGWWLVAISGFVMVIATVPLFHAMSLWFVALESDFQWSRTQLSLAFALTRVEGGVMGPVEGYLTDRLGTRRMVLIGLLILSVGFLLFWQVQNLWMFYLAFVVMALGQGLGSWVPLMTALNNWFVRRRASAIGWSNTGSRLGGLLLVPVIAWAIDPDHDRVGWQTTALILGIFTLLAAIPISRLIRNRPEEYDLSPDGDAAASRRAEASAASQGTAGGAPTGISPPSQPSPSRGKEIEEASRGEEINPPNPPLPKEGLRGLPLRKGSLRGKRVEDNVSVAAADFTAAQAIRTPAFWLISIGHGLTSMVIVAMMAHLGPLMKDEGFTLQTAAWVVTVYTALAVVFQIVGGYVGDRVPKNVAIFVFTTVQSLGVVVITISPSLGMAFLFAVLFGIGFGGRNPLTTAIRGDYFGRASFGKILGLSTVPINVLLLVAAPFVGIMRDTQGNYTVAFITLAAFSFLGGALFLFAKKPVLAPAPKVAAGAV